MPVGALHATMWSNPPSHKRQPDTQDAIRLSPSEGLTWVALQRLKHLGLLEERPTGFKLTQAGRDALRRLVLRV
jgi:hypothetical protein